MGHDERSEEAPRPWQSAIEIPDPEPATMGEARKELDELREIKAHREWVIDGLRAHVENIEADLSVARARVDALERHSANLEKESLGSKRHLVNLEARLGERESRLAEIEAEVVRLERRLYRHQVRFDCPGVLPTSRFPRLEALFRLGDRIREKREDLRWNFPDDRAASYWYWLLWHGASLEPEVEKGRYPEPERHLRTRVVGDEGQGKQYTHSGLVDGRTLDDCLREAGFDPAAGGTLLDFGVGCGRVLQYFALYSGACDLVGADVDSEAIDWCGRHLDYARFVLLNREPPSPFPASHFDAVYAFSVFSHLPEGLHREWLEDLHRITKPGAAVVLTVQGRRVIRAIEEDAWAGAFPKKRKLSKALPDLERRGFGFFPYHRLAYGRSDNKVLSKTLDLENYGSTFILPVYIRECWSDLFEVVAVREAPDDWQDYVVLRRRA